MKDINVSKIFQMKNIIEYFPFNLLDHENIPVTTYKLTATIRNKVFNYEQTVESIQLDEKQPLNDDIYPCNCENSDFYGTDHGHIITGNIRFIKNQKLRKPVTKSSNFRQLQSFNHSICKKEIDHAIEKFAGSLRLKHKL